MTIPIVVVAGLFSALFARLWLLQVLTLEPVTYSTGTDTGTGGQS